MDRYTVRVQHCIEAGANGGGASVSSTCKVFICPSGGRNNVGLAKTKYLRAVYTLFFAEGSWNFPSHTAWMCMCVYVCVCVCVCVYVGSGQRLVTKFVHVAMQNRNPDRLNQITKKIVSCARRLQAFGTAVRGAEGASSVQQHRQQPQICTGE